MRNLCCLHGLEWVIGVPHNIYGPGQRYWDPYRNVAGIMINRVLPASPRSCMATAPSVGACRTSMT